MLQDPLRGLEPPTVRRRSLLRSCDDCDPFSEDVGELASESMGLDADDELRDRVSARMSSRLTFSWEFGWTVFRSSVNFDVVIVELRLICDCPVARSGVDGAEMGLLCARI